MNRYDSLSDFDDEGAPLIIAHGGLRADQPKEYKKLMFSARQQSSELSFDGKNDGSFIIEVNREEQARRGKSMHRRLQSLTQSNQHESLLSANRGGPRHKMFQTMVEQKQEKDRGNY